MSEFNLHQWRNKYLFENELSKGQQKIASAAPPEDEITGADFRAMQDVKKEGEDHEVSMAIASLQSIVSSATQLMNKIGQEEKDIPAWIQDHITNAENYINQASKNYHEYGDGDEEDMPDNSINENEFSFDDFKKSLKQYKDGNIIKSQLITAYNKLEASDQDKAKELAKGLDVLPMPSQKRPKRF